jgi:hypothetical protein
MPTAFVAAFPHDARPEAERRLQTPEGERPYTDLMGWVALATVAGLPATTAPVGARAGGAVPCCDWSLPGPLAQRYRAYSRARTPMAGLAARGHGDPPASIPSRGASIGIKIRSWTDALLGRSQRPFC